jgi:RNA-directed DNA polymerase
MALEDASKKGRKVKDLFRLMGHPDLWRTAYANIHANKGANTPGISTNTMDGFSEDRVLNLIELLKEDRYQPSPVRRIHIPKANGKRRPLGLPTGDDKLVQEVVRMILERIYEPVFLEHSHGFRQGHSCHTALMEIQRCWTGVKWFVEVDIKGCFDNIDHGIMINILSKTILDKRFLNLITSILKAGYLEDWTYHRTYSGTPQGGVCSPILANIYLHELDVYLKERKVQFDKGKKRSTNPQYEAIRNHIRLLQNRVRTLKAMDPENPAIRDLMQEIRVRDRERKKLPVGNPKDGNYRRLLFCRYADDVLLGVIGSLQESREILQAVGHYLKHALNLELAEEKSHVVRRRRELLFLATR